MKVKIHRGAHEIGGNCIELVSGGARLVLDVGRPLDAPDGDEALLPVAVDDSLLGVAVSHAHQDHWGLASQLPASVPVFAGKATCDILREAAFFTTGIDLSPAGHLEHRVPFQVGPFTITPFLNDHSAFDAYSLLVQAEGKRVYYSGDLRGHGRKRSIFEELLRMPPADVDVLLLEGTSVRADDEERPDGPDERDVEMRCAELFVRTKGIALVTYSAQNIDRLVTLYRAAKRAGRRFVMDLYTATVARATGNPNIPQPGPAWPNVAVFVPGWQRVKVKQAEEFHRVKEIRSARIFEQALAAEPGRFVLKLDRQTLHLLGRHVGLTEATAIWSLWDGYLADSPMPATLEGYGIPLEVVHSSGHAHVSDLQRLAEAVSARRVVPIHSFGAARFADLFANVEVHPDGQWWDV